MKTLNVNLGSRSYPITIGSGILSRSQLYEPFLNGGRAFIVTNETVAPLYLDALEQALAELVEVSTCILPDGERHKILDTVSRILDQMLDVPCARDTVVFALGGGVVGDIAGFCAACYQRGIAFVQIPTTLLAQVDSSVGGKTGVNHPKGKNMIGAFHQPQAVIADIDTLQSLSDREMRAGTAEIIKYGAIRDKRFFEWLETNVSLLLERHPASVIHAVLNSCRNKSEVVAADEHETGIRAILNFGHTFGHAIEAALKYKEWLHGEAVAAGMVMAANFSNRLGLLDRKDVTRIEALIEKAGLPTAPPRSVRAQQLLEHMAVDKKTRAGVIRIIVLGGIGNASILADYDRSDLVDSIEHAFQA